MTNDTGAVINERTTIPLFAAVAAVAVVVPGIFWLSSVDSSASEGNRKASAVERKIEDVIEPSLVDIRERLIRIEDAVHENTRKATRTN